MSREEIDVLIAVYRARAGKGIRLSKLLKEYAVLVKDPESRHVFLWLFRMGLLPPEMRGSAGCKEEPWMSSGGYRAPNADVGGIPQKFDVGNRRAWGSVEESNPWQENAIRILEEGEESV